MLRLFCNASIRASSHSAPLAEAADEPLAIEFLAAVVDASLGPAVARVFSRVLDTIRD